MNDSSDLRSNPVIAIVGRPNVGKSTLLNRLAGRRVSIVHPMPGVTRDRVSVEARIGEGSYELVDTGGIGIVDRQDLHPDIHLQIDAALDYAQLVLFLVDARHGVHTMDAEIANRLRQRSVPVLLVANKCEAQKAQHSLGEFHSLGLGAPFAISAEHGEGIHELRDAVLENLDAGSGWQEPALRIAVVGRRNCGKSTFINALLEEERVIVSEVPGTTRDAIDVRFTKDQQEFLLIDTAGMQRRTKLKGDLEYYAQVRSIDAIQRAEVVLFLIDSVHGVSQLEKRIVSEVISRHRACVIVINKWDLAIGRTTTGEYEKYLGKILPGLPFAPMVFISASQARNVLDAVSVAQSLARQSRTRVTTGELNRVLERIKTGQRPPFVGGKEPKIYFASQVSVSPPTIVMMVNKPDFFPPSYRRYIEGRFREEFPFPEIPIRVIYRERGKHATPS